MKNGDESRIDSDVLEEMRENLAEFFANAPEEYRDIIDDALGFRTN